MRTAIYTRVSTELQVEEGFSLDAQLHRLRAYCESQGWTISDVYTDEGISAKNTERPQLQRMLDDIKAKRIDVVLVYKLDRLTRNVLDLHELLDIFDQYDVGFKSATEVFDTTTAMGRLFITIVAALAAWERENLGERVRFGQAEMVRQGRYFGHTPPYGYEKQDGKLYINPAEAPVIRVIFDRYLAGDGMSRLAAYLNDPANNIGRPRGSDKWSMKVVNAIIKNPVYCGFVRYGNKTRKKGLEQVIAKSDHAPIVTEEEWNRAQSLMKQRRILPARSGTGVHPLVGILRCGKCGGPMIGRTEHANGTRKTPYYGYMCNERRQTRTCDMKAWKREVIESAVIEEVERLVHERIQLNYSSPQEVVEDNNAQINRQLAQLKARRKKWLDAFNNDFISGKDLREQLDEIDKEEERLNATRTSAAETSELQLDVAVNLRTAWDVATPTEQRELIRSVVDTAWIFADGSVKVSLHGGF